MISDEQASSSPTMAGVHRVDGLRLVVGRWSAPPLRTAHEEPSSDPSQPKPVRADHTQHDDQNDGDRTEEPSKQVPKQTHRPGGLRQVPLMLMVRVREAVPPRSGPTDRPQHEVAAVHPD